jgi:hypothetical protein
MHSRVDDILDEISRLRVELEAEFNKQKQELYRHKEELLKIQKESVTRSKKYLLELPIGVVITIPFIWMMLIPALIADIFVTIYQAICFPIYKIPKVKRGDFIILDRHKLSYLNTIEKINCFYCGYFNGVISYVREISARTEQYWCPIKHSKTIYEHHSRYSKFFNYGDATKYKSDLHSRRKDFKDLEL